MVGITEAEGYYVPRECKRLLQTARLTVQTLRDLGFHDLADAEVPRLRELLRRSGSSDKLVLITSTGLYHTRITQPWGDRPIQVLTLKAALPSAQADV
jgi:hypothetical protein